MHGIVDSHIKNWIGGWVVCCNPSSHAIVALRNDGNLSNFSFAKDVRRDVNMAKGFVLRDLTTIDLFCLATSKHEVVCFEIPSVATINLDDICDLKNIATHCITIPILKEAAIKIGYTIFQSIFSDCHTELCLEILTRSSSLIDLKRLCIKPPSNNTLVNDETTELEFRVGTLSIDEASIVGKGGHLFLYNGSNALIKQYQDSSYAVSTANHWLSILTTRHSLCQEKNITFLQVVIPEKSSVLSALFPESITPPTHTMKSFQEMISQNGIKYVLDLYPEVLSDANVEQYYFKTDSHFSNYGAHKALLSIIQKLELDIDIKINLDKQKIHYGDIASRFPGVVESASYPSERTISHPSPDIVYSFDPPGGKHEQIHRVFKNKCAPINKTVVAFANSFFGTGITPNELSWHFSRLFSEFHFVWSRDLNFEYIETVKPDIVIAQTIERFLPVLPTT